MKKYILLFCMITAFSGIAFSENKDRAEDIKTEMANDNKLVMDKWYGGYYLTFGLGYAVTSTITHHETNTSAIGAHFSTALGYWAFDAYGIELGASISYNYFEDMSFTDYIKQDDGTYKKTSFHDFDMHFWDSSFYLGVMTRLPLRNRSDNLNPYLKLIIGYGTSVMWFDNIDFSDTQADGATRFYSEGPLFGIALGNIFNAFNDDTTWFFQMSFTTKMYSQETAIQDGTVLPEDVHVNDVKNDFHIYQMLVTFGVRLF